MIDQVQKQLAAIKKDSIKNKDNIYSMGKRLYEQAHCQVLVHSPKYWDILVSNIDLEEEDADLETEVRLNFTSDDVYSSKKGKAINWEERSVAALLEVEFILLHDKPVSKSAGRVYTREGMMKRVLEERKEKADKSKYKIKFADNIHGEHILTNEKGVKYAITLRDFEKETGYVDNMDLKINKLGTTKHIIFAFNELKSKPRVFKKLAKTYPFVEVFLDPQNDYRITWHYPHKLSPAISRLIQAHFGKKQVLAESKVKSFMGFLKDARRYPRIKLRPEVEEKVQKVWDEETLKKVRLKAKPDFSFLKVKLFPYQQAGVRFAAFRTGAILADEMGLGKTIQAIAVAILKKKHFGFKKCLIICPASLKEQWKKEIEKFSNEKAVIVEGGPKERQDTYRSGEAYFIIVNYETVLRDLLEINKMQPDFVVLDEAQRIKNFKTITAQNIKQIQKRHSLVITGTPIENRLSDLYSIMQFVQPDLLTPLWEFSYQHCFFDESKKDKITGYFNLQQLKERLSPYLLRREKHQVLKELPKVTEITVPVSMHPVQQDYHASYAKGIAAILRKKFISQFDMQRLMLLLANMRMVCDSTFLIDKETFHSPKLEELEHILLEKFDLQHSNRKIIIFSEWTQMLHMIGKMLQNNGIGFAQLSGQVKVKNRGLLVKKFETDDTCKVFLSTEAGGSGLNLQVADTVINFELPWNPAKKNQRIGRIDRLGQLKKQLTVINLVTQKSIEIKIASGLNLKQSLFDGVLSTAKGPDYVDFSNSGKAQFLHELESMMAELSQPSISEVSEVTQTQTAKTETPSIKNLITEQDVSDGLAVEKSGKFGHPSNGGVDNSAPSDGQVSQDDQRQAGSTVVLETVLNNGMDFLSGLLQMATGKSIGLEGKTVEVDQATGEVVMRFKLPTI